MLAFDALRAGGVDVRVLKGVALARLDYGEPQDRIFGDVDLLIRREDHQAALAALCGGGFARALPPVRLGWERRFSKALMMIAPNGSELDLHMALAGGYFGARFDHESMWRRVGATFELAGRTMTALDEADRLIHACLHGELGGGSGLRVRRDIAQLALASGLAWEDARNRAAQSGCDVVVAAGISNTWQMLDLDARHPCAVWASAYVGSARQQEMLSLYHRGSPSEWAPEARSTLAALGRIDQARFIAGLTFPSRSSLAARQRTPVSHVRQAIRSIASRRVPAE